MSVRRFPLAQTTQICETQKSSLTSSNFTRHLQISCERTRNSPTPLSIRWQNGNKFAYPHKVHRYILEQDDHWVDFLVMQDKEFPTHFFVKENR